MSTIEPHSQINPAEDRIPSQREVVVHPIPLPREAAGRRETVRRRRGGRHRAKESSWPALLERVLRSWPATLRMALLLAILLAGLTGVAAAMGIAAPLLVITVGYRARHWLRRLTRTGRKRAS